MIKTYGELKKGDVIFWHGGKCRVTAVRVEGRSSYTNDRVIRFDVEPYDEECVKILGSFYSHGTYGGIESLRVETAM